MSLSDVAAFQADVGLKADSYTGASNESAAIDTAGYHQALIVLNAGETATGGTADVTVEAATTSSGSYTAITGAAFTQITPDNDDAVYLGRINLDGTDRFLKVKAACHASNASELSVSVILTPYYTGDGATFEFEV